MFLLNKPFFFLFFLTVLIATVYSDSDDDPCGDGQINECIICLCGCKDRHGFKKFLCELQCTFVCACDGPGGCAG
ncbi:hypothetical protein C1646_708999 [Rhizophagus diaphanus]|nr:hypothetical protein C1646_708999 [Rhizophagus diaphanus] [Rhizophagus sp. MUCL 43196]